MFMFHAAFSLELIALTAGVFLYGWALQGKAGSGLGKFFGFIVILLSVISILCSGYWGMKMWQMRDAGSACMMCMHEKAMATTETNTEASTTTNGNKSETTQTKTTTTKKKH